jgi:hypothetical protein
MRDAEKIEFIERLQKRTKGFSPKAIQIFKKFPRDEAQIIGRQFLRSALSVGANYRAQPKTERFAKLSITVEEADVLARNSFGIENSLVGRCDLFSGSE